MEYYGETGIVKAPAVAEFVLEHYFPDESLQDRKKVLIFAHHVVVLDTISIMLAKKGIKCIRIDGSTKSVDRETYCDRFQNDEDVLVALLSLTAAGLGINLTAASIVVFAELTWNPGVS
jgi:SWI/SNF-related matrix-associated actin-dependent regulator of chromatin subfamily A-like protein 1